MSPWGYLWWSPSAAARLARAVLAPASWGYGLGVRLRNALYDSGRLRVHRVGVPVVAVGNIRVGGTGKTPFVIWLVGRLRERGKRVVIVARGVGGDRPAVLVPPRVAIPAGEDWIVAERWWESQRLPADEAILLCLRTATPVVTDPDRVRGCRRAIAAFAPDLIVLDDGFQHRRLARELDIVLLDSNDRRARMLPAGPLREPPSALARADIVVECRGAAVEPSLVRRPVGLVRGPERIEVDEPISALAGRRVFAFAGIARPESFFSALEQAGATIVGHRRFADHYRYRERDWLEIRRRAAGAQWIVTTEKDAVKLMPFASGDDRFMVLRIAADVEPGDQILERVCQLDAPRRGHHDRPAESSGE